MDSIGPSGRVTSSTGDVDSDGELVGELGRQARRAIDLARTSLEETGVVAQTMWDMVDERLDALLCARIGTALDVGPYRERPGLDERITEAGADVASVRRMLRLSA